MSAIIGFVGVIIGSLMTYLINITQFKREKNWQQKQLTVQKLEKICEIVEDLENKYRQITGDMFNFIENGTIANLNSPLPMQRLKILIYFYTPGLKDLLHQLEETQKLYGQCFMKAIDSKGEDNIKRQQAIAELFNIDGLITKACRMISNACAEHAIKYLNSI